MSQTTGHGFSETTFKLICSTIDFFLDFNQETVDRLHETLWHGYGLWHQERQKHPVEQAFKERAKLLDIPDENKKPWDWGDVRANNPIRLLNHLWSIGHLRKDAPLFSLKAFAIATALKEGSPVWENEILEEAMRLQHLEKEIHKAGNKHYKEWKDKQTKGLNQKKLEKSFKIELLKKQVHDHATTYLEKGKPKKDIAGLILKYSNIKNSNNNPIQKRDIYRYLKTHNSGLWK